MYAHAGKTTGIPIHVFGTETHMTAIVGMALGHRPIPNQPPAAAHTANFLLNASGSPSVSPFPSSCALQASPATLTLTDLAPESFRLQRRAEQPPSPSPNRMILLQPRRQNRQHLLVSPALEMTGGASASKDRMWTRPVLFLDIKGSDFVVPIFLN